VEWAQTNIVYASFLEGNKIRNHLDDVGGVYHFIYGCAINHLEAKIQINFVFFSNDGDDIKKKRMY
jgi:hypothetical protein